MDSDHESGRQDEQHRLGELLTKPATVHGAVTGEELADARAEWS